MSAIVKKYDDLIRCTTILTEGIENEFHRFVSHQDECRKKWLSCEQDNHNMKQFVAKYKAEKDTLDIKLKHARNQLESEMKKRLKAEQNVDHMARQLQLIRELILDKDNTNLTNQDRQALAQSMHQFSHIETESEQPRASLLNQSYTFDDESSMLSPDEYDNTEDDILDETTGSVLGDRRRSKKGNKRVRQGATAPVITDETETDETTADDHSKKMKIYDEDKFFRPSSKKRRRFKHRTEVERTVETHVQVTRKSFSPKKNIHPTEPLEREFSRPPPMEGKRPPSRQHLKEASSNSDLTDITIDSYHNPQDQGVPSSQIRVISKQTSVPNIYPSIEDLISPDMKKKFNTIHAPPSEEKRRALGHTFATKIAVRMELCGPCNKRLRFGSSVVKCRDCKIICHPECKDQAPLPCFPTKDTPGKKREGTIEAYVPSKGLKVPPLVIACVEEIESRGMDELGLYRVSGNDKDVKELKEKFLRGKSPDLAKYLDIHVVCGCLKDFIRGLSEPLVTFSLHESFMVAAAMADADDSLAALYQCISELSLANRDTLAYIMVHLQKVAKSEPTHMHVSNLAKLFGPTLIAHRSPNPTHMEMLEDIKAHPIVVARLLEMPADYWNQFLNTTSIRNTPPYNPSYWQPGNTPKTPESKQAPETRLGPLDPNTASIQRTNTQTPRFGTKNKDPSKRPKHFFDSPH